MTVAEIITAAKWLAREHAADLDPFAAADWLDCVQAGWRRLWALHPEAFHSATVRVGAMPTVPTSTATTAAVGDGWETILAAAAAAHAVRALRPADEGAMILARETVERLEGAVTAGTGAL
jgi:hypothetical protein